MSNMKTALGFIAGIATVAAVACVAAKVMKEIDETPSVSGEYQEKAQRWFTQKRDMFKGMIDDKNKQINDIVTAVKEELISEEDAEKRRQLIENATGQISKLKDDISGIVSQRSKEMAEMAKAFSQSDMFGNVVKTVNNVRASICPYCKNRNATAPVADITYFEE